MEFHFNNATTQQRHRENYRNQQQSHSERNPQQPQYHSVHYPSQSHWNHYPSQTQAYSQFYSQSLHHQHPLPYARGMQTGRGYLAYAHGYPHAVQLILDAIRRDDDVYLRFIVGQQPRTSQLQNQNGTTLLMMALQCNAIKCLQYLTRLSTVDKDLCDADNETVIYKAAAMGNTNAVKDLIEVGANVDIENKDGMTPLIISAYNGHFDIVQLLIDQGHANISSQDNTLKTPLSFAAYEGHTHIVSFLISRGADINTIDEYGWTPLMLAANAGRLDVCKLLVQANANLNSTTSNGKNAVQLANDNGHIQLAQFLSQSLPVYVYHPISSSAIPNKPLLGPVNKPLPPPKSTSSSIMKSHPLINNNSTSLYQKDLPRFTEQRKGHLRNISHSNRPVSANASLPQASLSMPPSHGRLQENVRFQRSLASFDNDVVKSNRSKLQRKSNKDIERGMNNGIISQAALLRRRTTKRNARLPGGGIDVARGGKSAPIEKQVSKMNWWSTFYFIVTCCCCSPFLKLFGLRDKRSQRAWREKVALCFLILLSSALLGFLTFGLSALACKEIQPIYPNDVWRMFGPNQPNMKVMIVRGRLYNVGVYFASGAHRPLLGGLEDKDLKGIIEPLYGNDASAFFPPNTALSGCPWSVKDYGTICNQNGDVRYHCHTSYASVKQLQELATDMWVGWDWGNITSSSNGKKLFVYKGIVYDISSYLDISNNNLFLGDDLLQNVNIQEWMSTLVGRDVSKEIVSKSNLSTIASCFDDYFAVGRLTGTTIGCFASDLILVTMITMLLSLMIIKFMSAVAFSLIMSWRLGFLSEGRKKKQEMSNIFLFVACYSEGEASMRKTLDALALTDYSEDHKVLFVIADGNIVGAGNDRSTPQICLDLMERTDPSMDPEPCSYIAVGDGLKRHNMAQVYTGYYTASENTKGKIISIRRVPMILIVKCGTESEREAIIGGKKGVKAGNRGKRDSQLILMQWLSKVHFNERMTELDFQMFEKLRELTSYTPDTYQMVLMVDADTIVKHDSVSRMVAAMERDPKVMGLCGETQIVNKAQSWVTMIQVFEYYISHHLAKAFESIFGGVTCLPGCFCMYRIMAPKANGYQVPILANPDIVELYSSNVVETLHQKNLLLLGEDRYLTTLMLRSFPKRKMIYVPKAICQTEVPSTLRVLISQRRRWINSTIHNLMELILVPELCGIFCFSMQFVLFLDIFGTVVLPAAFVFMLYLLVRMAFGDVSILLPLIFMLLIIGLQAFLVIFASGKPTYIYWMIIYLLAMPVWNFILPIYAFWHFDDFSWGATRKVDGPLMIRRKKTVRDKHGKKVVEEVFNVESIPVKKWHEWMALRMQENRNYCNRTGSGSSDEGIEEEKIEDVEYNDDSGKEDEDEMRQKNRWNSMPMNEGSDEEENVERYGEKLQFLREYPKSLRD